MHVKVQVRNHTLEKSFLYGQSRSMTSNLGCPIILYTVNWFPTFWWRIFPHPATFFFLIYKKNEISTSYSSSKPLPLQREGKKYITIVQTNMLLL